MKILGISAYYHDSAACLIEDGEIVAAAQEERFTRIKNDASFPRESLKFVISQSSEGIENIDVVAFYDKPFLKFDRLLETYLAFAPRGFKNFRNSLPVWLKDKLFQKNIGNTNEFRIHCIVFLFISFHCNYIDMFAIRNN